MIHILERFMLHFVAATFLTLGVYFGLRLWLRKTRKVASFLSANYAHLLVTSALIVFAIAPLREPLDIYLGNNSIVKSFFDQASWCLGAAVSAFGLYRFKSE